MTSLAGIEAKILFYEERVKKIAANSPVQMFINVMKSTLLKNNFKK